MRVAGAGSQWETQTNESLLFETPPSGAAAVGIYTDLSLGSPWSLQAEAQAAWDRGFGGVGRVALVGPRHALTLTGWRANSRSSRVVLPTDSLRDIGMNHRVLGVRLQAATTLTVGALSISPALHWEEERVGSGGGDTEGFLQASPDGKSSMRGMGISAAAGRWTLRGQYRHRDLDLESSILRAGGSAGRVAYTRLSLDAWSAAASAARSDRVWSLEVGGERLDGALSARVETWPFATLWETLSVQAFRLQAGLEGRSIWWRFRNAGVSNTSWDWGADVGRYVLLTDRDSWYVTSFGFGRSDRQTTTGGADPAIVVGGMLARSFPFGAGDMKVRLVAGMPVHAATVGRAQDDTKSPQALVGYFALSAQWVR